MDKQRNAIFKRTLALFLAFALMLGTLPDMMAHAEGDAGGLILSEDDRITAFDALPQDVAAQSVTTGTPQDALVLPDTLEAEVNGVAVTVHTQSDAEADSMAVTVPVAAWQSSPEYDGDAEGLYIFTPELSGEYTVAEGVTPPVIAVTVTDALSGASGAPVIPSNGPMPMSPEAGEFSISGMILDRTNYLTLQGIVFGAIIELHDCDGKVDETISGGLWGTYTFTGLDAGEYTIKVLAGTYSGYDTQYYYGEASISVTITDADLTNQDFYLDKSVPTSVTTQPSSQTVNEGRTATFSVAAATTSGTLTYLWQVNQNDGNGFVDLGTQSASDTYTTSATVRGMNGWKYRVRIYNDDAFALTSDVAVLTVLPIIKNVSVGTQSGTLTAGTAGSAIYTVTTANIEDNSAITLNNINSVAGISLVTAVTTNAITNVTISTTASTPQGTHPLTLTIDGTTSAEFALTIAEPTWFSYSPALVSGTYIVKTGQPINLTITAVSDDPLTSFVLLADDLMDAGVTQTLDLTAKTITLSHSATTAAMEGTYRVDLQAKTSDDPDDLRCSTFYIAISSAAGNITAGDITFNTVQSGYSQPPARAIVVSKNVIGNSLFLTDITVTPNTAFEIIPGDHGAIPDGGTNRSWSIQPRYGLSAGVYTATITVLANGSGNSSEPPTAAATATVTIEVTEPKTYSLSIWLSNTISHTTIMVSGATLELYDGSGKIATTTDANTGKYTFTGLAPGEYTVKFPAGSYGGQNYREASTSVTITNADVARILIVTRNTAPQAYAIGVDNYKFANAHESFGYKKNYCIPVERYAQLFGNTAANNLYKQSGVWGGSCFGFSVTDLAFFSNKLAFSDYQTGVSNVYSFTAPGSPSKPLTKLLELFQVSQYASVISKEMHLNNKNQTEKLVAAVEAFQAGHRDAGVVLGVLSPENGGHAIVPYAIEQNDTYSYTISIYDNNWPDDADRTMVVNTNTGYWSYELWDGLVFTSSDGDYFGFANYKDVFNLVDSVTKISSTPMDGMNIMVPRGSRIQNESGIGIEDIPEAFETIPMSLMPGASPPDKQLFAAPADQYRVLSGGGNGNEATFFDDSVSFYAKTGNSSATIDGKLGGGDFVRINCDGQNDFTIQYGTDDTAASPLTLTGSAQGDVSAAASGNGLLVTGATTLTATSGGKSTTYTITDDQTAFIPYNNGGGNNDGGGSSSGSSSSTTNAVLSETITKDMAQQVLDKAQQETNHGYSPEFNFSTTVAIDSLNITFNADALALLESAGIKETTVTANVFRFSLDLAAVKELNKQSGGNAVTLTASRFGMLSDAAKAYIGSRPAWDITISYKNGGNTENISNLGAGCITMGMKYTPASTEKPGYLAVVYVPGSGQPQVLTNSSYVNGWMIWQRNSLSVYGTGYITSAPAFTDTADHWAQDNIDFVVSRGLIGGTGATVFSPDTAITSADFLMAIGKLSGTDVSGYTASSFTDVANTDPAMPYIEWAVKNGIVQDMGNHKFGPDQQVTREQMALMMVNYAKATGYTLPVSRQAVTFADDAKISRPAKDAVKAIQQAGIIVGKGSNLFDPQSNATRAEASTILRRFVELVIDESTARGWVQNDAGQWQYINIDGKPAVNTTIDGYTLGEDGVMKE